MFLNMCVRTHPLFLLFSYIFALFFNESDGLFLQEFLPGHYGALHPFLFVSRNKSFELDTDIFQVGTRLKQAEKTIGKLI